MYCTELGRPRELFPWKLRILEILYNPQTERCARIPAEQFKRPDPPSFNPKKFMPKVEEVKPVEEVKAEEPKPVEQQEAEQPKVVEEVKEE